MLTYLITIPVILFGQEEVQKISQYIAKKQNYRKNNFSQYHAARVGPVKNFTPYFDKFWGP